MESRYMGCLLGLVCGDAVGTTVEFKPRGSFEPVTNMVGGGPYGLRPGEWTDDTSMALCLAVSLLEMKGVDPKDQIDRYVRWWKQGYLSSTGRCFDIGGATQEALARFVDTGDPYSGSTDPGKAGNGSIMRLAPVPMYFAADIEKVVAYSAESSRTTHGTQETVDACKLFGLMIALALKGNPKEEILFNSGHYLQVDQLSPKVANIARGTYRQKNINQIRGSGYVIASLEAASWVFLNTESFEEAVLSAVNLGQDADTTGAVVGQLAGAYYGVKSIPKGWLDKLKHRDLIQTYAQRLFAERFKAR